MLLDQRHRLIKFCSRRQPMGLVLAPEPGALTLGELPRALGGDSVRFRLVHRSFEELQGLAVANGLQQS